MRGSAGITLEQRDALILNGTLFLFGSLNPNGTLELNGSLAALGTLPASGFALICINTFPRQDVFCIS